MSKYFMVMTIAMLPTTMFSFLETSSSFETDKAYILGFEDGSEAMAAAANAEMCAQHYQSQGQNPGAECYEFYKKAKVKLEKYEKIKKKLKKSNERKKKNGKNSKRNKKNSN